MKKNMGDFWMLDIYIYIYTYCSYCTLPYLTHPQSVLESNFESLSGSSKTEMLCSYSTGARLLEDVVWPHVIVPGSPT